jgi:hypothetical protein
VAHAWAATSPLSRCVLGRGLSEERVRGKVGGFVCSSLHCRWVVTTVDRLGLRSLLPASNVLVLVDASQSIDNTFPDPGIVIGGETLPTDKVLTTTWASSMGHNVIHLEGVGTKGAFI